MAAERQSTTAAARLGRLEAEVDSIKGDIHGLRRAFEGFTQEMRSGSRPQWGTFIAGGSLIVVIITSLVVLGSQGPISTLEDLKSEVAAQHKTDIESAFTRGQAEARATAVEKQLSEVAHHVQIERANRFTMDDGRELDARLDQEVKRVWSALDEHRHDGHPYATQARVSRLEDHIDRGLDTFMEAALQEHGRRPDACPNCGGVIPCAPTQTIPKLGGP